ncbi:hypothetical protein [Kamptonema formosum]|uniref:hypothetical protein n=1 Tax=Kamptonema formosum TaxID=331992 RepID=UPI00034BAD06|nr:hypothetical protein [Oscillatoria sp. PCC 10802]
MIEAWEFILDGGFVCLFVCLFVSIPLPGLVLAKNLLLLPPAEIIVAFIWASLHNRDAAEDFAA